MKRMYEMPMAYEEAFVANEYVSACITGIIQCAYPSNGRTNGRTDKFDDYNGHKSGYWTDHKENFMDYVVMMEISILELTVILED